VAKNTGKFLQLPEYPYVVAASKGGCGSVEFVSYCITVVVIKVENDCCDVGRPSSCIASQLPPFLIIICT